MKDPPVGKVIEISESLVVLCGHVVDPVGDQTACGVTRELWVADGVGSSGQWSSGNVESLYTESC